MYNNFNKDLYKINDLIQTLSESYINITNDINNNCVKELIFKIVDWWLCENTSLD